MIGSAYSFVRKEGDVTVLRRGTKLYRIANARPHTTNRFAEVPMGSPLAKHKQEEYLCQTKQHTNAQHP